MSDTVLSHQLSLRKPYRRTFALSDRRVPTVRASRGDTPGSSQDERHRHLSLGCGWHQ
jgi:hypothetical protein